jgi:hypothetical protein
MRYADATGTQKDSTHDESKKAEANACLLSGCQYAVTLRLPPTHTSLSNATSCNVQMGHA